MRPLGSRLDDPESLDGGDTESSAHKRAGPLNMSAIPATPTHVVPCRRFTLLDSVRKDLDFSEIRHREAALLVPSSYQIEDRQELQNRHFPGKQ